MAEQKGNGQQGMDLLFRLHAEVLELSQAMDRHHEEQKSHVRRIAEMIMAIADTLNSHELRIAAVEAKVH